MATFPYIMGESGTLGFPIDQFDGKPMPLDGLGLRLVIFLAGADLVIPGRADSGPVTTPSGGIVDHPSIAAFELTPENTPAHPRLYRCALQINDGNGWKNLPGGEHLINVRNL